MARQISYLANHEQHPAAREQHVTTTVVASPATLLDLELCERTNQFAVGRPVRGDECGNNRGTAVRITRDFGEHLEARLLVEATRESEQIRTKLSWLNSVVLFNSEALERPSPRWLPGWSVRIEYFAALGAAIVEERRLRSRYAARVLVDDEASSAR